jgi:proteasome component ECM29
MVNIWDVLVAEPEKTTAQFFAAIMADLLAHMGDKHWRVRESCCNALCDILSGRDWPILAPFLKDTWLMTFRALDDVKESVREAALGTCKKLGRVSILLCKQREDSTHARAAMAVLLPVLVDTGLLSSVDTVREASLGIMLELIDEAGDAVQPHAVSLILLFLEALSGLESPLLNYFSARLTNDNVQVGSAGK